MLLIGTKNFGTQTVLADGLVNLGTTYRKFCKRNRCGVPAFAVTSNGISLQHEGIYHITATFVGSGSVAGVATIQLYVNGVAVDGALSSQTITTADTEVRTFVIDYYVKVDRDCILGVDSTVAESVSFVNTSDAIDITLTSAIVNVDKVV
jgi:hypothetical protein